MIRPISRSTTLTSTNHFTTHKSIYALHVIKIYHISDNNSKYEDLITKRCYLSRGSAEALIDHVVNTCIIFV